MEGGNTQLDTALLALAHEGRREVLDALEDNEEASVEVTDESKKAALIHNHLPKLADYGYIEYEHNRDSVTVRRGPDWEILADLYTNVKAAELG